MTAAIRIFRMPPIAAPAFFGQSRGVVAAPAREENV